MKGSRLSSPGVVEVHCLHLGMAGTMSEEGLSQAEKDRAARFRRPADRHRYVAARRLCRTVIARLVGCAPGALQMEIAEGGKPWLPDYPEIGFSLSYGGDAAMLAISGTGPIGFDVEPIGMRAPGDDTHLPSLVLSAAELSWLGELQAPERARAFLTYWVKKEAVLKCLGTGLLKRPDEVTVAPPVTQRETICLPGGRFFLCSGTCSWNERGFLWAVATPHAPHDIAWQHYDDVPWITLPEGGSGEPDAAR